MDFTQLLVLDVKHTSWEDDKQPKDQFVEPIKIDVALVDTKKSSIIEKEEIFILPKKSKVSKYCEDGTGISQALLEHKGVPFTNAYRRLYVHYMSKDRFCAGWGNSDRISLERQVKAMELEPLFNKYPFFDINRLFCMMTGNDITEVGLFDAFAWSAIEIDQNDAVNLANLFLKMAKGLKPSIVQKLKNNSQEITKHLN